MGSQTTVEPHGTETPYQSGGGGMSNTMKGFSCLNVGSSAAGNNGVNEIRKYIIIDEFRYLFEFWLYKALVLKVLIHCD